MKFSKILAVGMAAGLCSMATAKNANTRTVGTYLPIDGFFGTELSEKWQPLEEFQPVRIEMIEREYPVAISETNDVDVAMDAIKNELRKYYTEEDCAVLIKILGKQVKFAVAGRSNLNMAENEAVSENIAKTVVQGMNDFFDYKRDVLEKAGSKQLKFKNNPEEDKENFKYFTISDMFDFLDKMQIPVKRNTLEIIARTDSRAILLYNEFIPVTLGEKFELSARLFSKMNPSEEEVKKKAGMPSTLDVNQQVLQKKIGGFAVYFYNAAQKEIGHLYKLYVTEDYQRQRVSWKFDIARAMGEDTAYIRVGIVVAPAKANAPFDDPVEFSDIRLQFAAYPPGE